MRVLILTNIPSPYRVDFYNELGKHVQLTVLYERQHASDREAEWINNVQRTFNEVYINCIPVGTDRSIGFGWLKYIAAKDYDILCVSGYSSPTVMMAITYCRVRGIPYVVSSDGAMLSEEGMFKAGIKRFLVSGASGWLCTGKSSADYLNRYGAKGDATFIYPFSSLTTEEILPEPISDLEKIRLRAEVGIKEIRAVLSIGRFIPGKGIDVLIKACLKIGGDVGIYIVGGEPTPDYIKLTRELNLGNVHFVGFKAKEELKKYYRAADLFVLPTREDIWGLVINEAMAYGLPVVTTDRCGAGLELIEDGANGYIVPVDDENILAEKMHRILTDPGLRFSMAQKNLDKIRKYTIEAMAERHIGIFTALQASAKNHNRRH